jgi:hypothetical protein
MILVPATPRRDFLFGHVHDESDVSERLKLDQKRTWKSASCHSDLSPPWGSRTPRVRLLDSSHPLQTSFHGPFGADLHCIPRILTLHLDLYFITVHPICWRGPRAPCQFRGRIVWEHHPTKPPSFKSGLFRVMHRCLTCI